jgi:hypothetical protein
MYRSKLRIRDVHLGSDFFPSQIPDPRLTRSRVRIRVNKVCFLTQKTDTMFSKIRSGMFIPDPRSRFFPSRISIRNTVNRIRFFEFYVPIVVDPDQDPVRSETFRKVNPDPGSSGSDMNLKFKKVGSGSGKKSFRIHNTLILQGNFVPDGKECVGLLEEHQLFNSEIHEAVQQLQASLCLRVLSLVVGNTSLIKCL